MASCVLRWRIGFGGAEGNALDDRGNHEVSNGQVGVDCFRGRALGDACGLRREHGPSALEHDRTRLGGGDRGSAREALGDQAAFDELDA